MTPCKRVPAESQVTRPPRPSVGVTHVVNLAGRHPRVEGEKGGRGAHPEGGVEVDVVGSAHLVVLLRRAVQGGDADGSSPV